MSETATTPLPETPPEMPLAPKLPPLLPPEARPVNLVRVKPRRAPAPVPGVKGRFLTDAQKRVVAARAAVCRSCDQNRGVKGEHVGCKACGCAGLDLATGKCPKDKWQQRLLLRSKLSPGDILMLTAAVRDLHLAYPGHFLTAVDTSCKPIWDNNPHVVKLDAAEPGVKSIDLRYPLVNQSNTAPYHFIHGYRMDLEQQLGLPIPATQFRGDIHLTDVEKGWRNQVVDAFGYHGKFWILMGGGKYDYTAKWWNPHHAQAVVDRLRGKVQFIQCGAKDHFHPPLNGTFNLVGKTDLRQMIRLMYHADGVLCPVTFAMHLAAAVPTKTPRHRPCVVVAGGREPPHWEAYPGHQYLHTMGMLPCCAEKACWRSRCQTLGDGDAKDSSLCDRPVVVNATEGRPFSVQGKERDWIMVPKCLDMITPDRVVAAIEGYLQWQQ